MNTVVSDGGRGMAVVGDGSAASLGPGEVLAALAADVRLLRAHGPVAAFPVAVTVRDASQLSSALRALPSGTTALFLARTEADRARAAQAEMALTSTTPVITEQDTAGMALAAALLVTLRRAGMPPRSSRVVVTGARTLPMLVPLLMAAGVADIASWHETDTAAFPLDALAGDATAVIDLVGAAAGLPAEVPVLSPDPVGHLLALPGMLRALRETPLAGPGTDPLYRLDVHRACAGALAALTPVDRTLPDLTDPDLADCVARAATEALRAPFRESR
ncbi:hypothetical protein HFP15_06280 [Amycolatopsis sp. K13G38]|uniref:Uncharacterized protein n=1 Tax=Amycolatopsis acididurans TaxID=2724524 RepID=A0ABX1IYB0_9PSEU|nr:hypothetical protein [Amycolatopsis acididurans]NKQ52482.1 hypothetical protein [Amycolatopsis acididurans]